jgi:hypothetical protein
MKEYVPQHIYYIGTETHHAFYPKFFMYLSTSGARRPFMTKKVDGNNEVSPSASREASLYSPGRCEQL